MKPFGVGNPVSLKHPLPNIPQGSKGHVTTIYGTKGCEVTFKVGAKDIKTNVAFTMLTKA